MKVLIVGAGIGGLTSALCLAKSGHSVHVFEQAVKAIEVGAGLQCGANAMQVLQHLGLRPRLEALSVQPQSIQFRDYKTGASLYSIELGNAYAKRYGAPYLHVHRADLLNVLTEQAEQYSNIHLHYGRRLLKYTEHSSHVNITLIDGSQIRGDLLVGCDGIKSVVRTQLFGHIEPRFTGNVAWRAVMPRDNLPEQFMPKVVTNFVGPNKHMVLYYVRNSSLLNMVGVVENSHWRDDSWVAKSSWSELRTDFFGWHSMVDDVINAADKDACFRWALYDHRPLSNWGSACVTLLGDAAHSTLPFMASGAAMAIEDARILQRCLDSQSDVPRALQAYERNRKQRTARIQNTSRRFGQLYHIKHSLLRRAAFAGLTMMGGKKEDFLPDYNANSVELI